MLRELVTRILNNQHVLHINEEESNPNFNIIYEAPAFENRSYIKMRFMCIDAHTNLYLKRLIYKKAQSFLTSYHRLSMQDLRDYYTLINHICTNFTGVQTVWKECIVDKLIYSSIYANPLTIEKMIIIDKQKLAVCYFIRINCWCLYIL